MHVLVVGATGVIGRETVRRLGAEGHRVRAMTRDVARAGDLATAGAQPFAGDLIDRDSLVRACEGVDAVFATAHGLLGRGRYRSEAVDDAGHRALIDVAAAARVARFVYTSALGAAPDHRVDFFRTKWAIEQYLARSGLDYVILRPAALMEWHAHVFNGKALLERGRTVILGSGKKRRNFVAAADVATIATRALLDPAPPARIIEIAGPGNYTNDDVARLYARIADKPAHVVHVPRPLLRLLAGAARPLHPGLARVLRIAGMGEDAFPETFDSARAPGPYPLRPTSLEEFVRERVVEQRVLSRR